MNFLQICQRVLDEGDRVVGTIDSVDVDETSSEQVYKVVQWVKRAYEDIQLWQEHYGFHWQSGTLLTTVAGQKDYTVANVRSIDPQNVFARRQGETSEWPLTFLTYKEWKDRFAGTILSDGPPSFLVRLPNESFRLVPAPDQVYEIQGDWQIGLDRLERDYDVPIWSADFHELIVWVALRYYTSEFEVPEELMTRIQESIHALQKPFYLKYLPRMEEF